MKKIIALLLVVVLIAAVAIGGTVAYLSDTASEPNTMTLGNVSIEQHEYERVVDENGNLVKGVLGEDFTEAYGITESYKLQPFTQGKPAYPAVYQNGTTAWDEFQQLWNQVGAPGSNDLFDDSMKNVVDKFVFVENTGKFDAYYRTIIAIEAPEGLPNNTIHINFNANSRFDYNADKEDVQNSADSNKFYITINGVRYRVYVATYTQVLVPGEVSRPSLLQVFLDPKATNEDCALFGDTWDILVVSQAVQTAGFDNAATALDAAFGKPDAENAAKWFNGISIDSPTDDDELKDDLQGDNKTIVVNLTGDMTYDVAAWQNEAMGGAETEKVIINGNGHTITFNNTNSDWNNIVTNGATLIINNAKVNNAGHDATSGTWNAHDINFGCKVEFNNVTFLNAVAVADDAVFNNVTITDDSTGDAYMLWVRAKGQTVVLNGCTLDATGTDGNDRGIKIDEEYIDAPEKVTLTVKNTTFKTEKKAAILVKSAAGADITLENVDISGVAADTTNAVWVDSDAAQHVSLVTVTGGSVITEQ